MGVGSKTLSRTQPRPARWFQKNLIRFKSGDAVWLSGRGYPSHEAHRSRARHRGGTGSNPSTPDGATCSRRAGLGLRARARRSGHFPPVVAPSVAGLAALPGALHRASKRLRPGGDENSRRLESCEKAGKAPFDKL